MGDGASASTREPSEVRADPAARRGPSAGSDRTGAARLILTGLLAAVVIVGVGAGPALGWARTWHGPWHDHGETIGIALEVILAGLLVTLWVLYRTRPQPGWPASRLRAVQPPVIGMLMVAVAIYLVRNTTLPKPHARPQPPRPLHPPAPSATPSLIRAGRTVSGVGPVIEYVLLALLAVAVITVLVALLRRRLEQRVTVDTDLMPEDDEGEMLRRAAEAGRAALRAIPESRRAIIACYLAMEGSLSLAGAARAAAETPDELLARASAIGLLHGEAGARLTALFYGARFSTQPVPDSARHEALAALDAILADLGDARRASHRLGAGPAVTP